MLGIGYLWIITRSRAEVPVIPSRRAELHSFSLARVQQHGQGRLRLNRYELQLPELLALTNPITGGALKLKGSAGVTKKKKKKKSTVKLDEASTERALSASRSESPSKSDLPKSQSPAPSDAVSKTDDLSLDPFDEEALRARGKTETEIRFEMMRHKMLLKKLKKEGVKSHKEKVEEYNKYLASLSEHHDMWVILRRHGGPEDRVLTETQAAYRTRIRLAPREGCFTFCHFAFARIYFCTFQWNPSFTST